MGVTLGEAMGVTLGEATGVTLGEAMGVTLGEAAGVMPVDAPEGGPTDQCTVCHLPNSVHCMVIKLLQYILYRTYLIDLKCAFSRGGGGGL